MPDRFTPPDIKEAALHSELLQAANNKNYDRVIELVQILKGLSSRELNMADTSTSSKREARAGLSPSRERYERFTASGLKEFKENELPLFLQLDVNAATSVGDTRKTLTVTSSKQAAFLMFSTGANSGEIYPNSRISFTESMKYVWAELNYNNWPAKSVEVQPVRVNKSNEGVWVTE